MSDDNFLEYREMPGKVLPRSFYARPTTTVARDLLGKILAHGHASGRILEVEAYLPRGDRAAHAHRGRTPRTGVLFGPPGHAYVFLAYGIHHCLNVVVEPEGTAGCVLIRSVEGLGDGPGKLTRALGITLRDNGADLTCGSLVIRDGPPPRDVRVTPRIGIRHSADLPLRFLLDES
jgi:DNA-3-methyladenine glycosylase